MYIRRTNQFIRWPKLDWEVLSSTQKLLISNLEYNVYFSIVGNILLNILVAGSMPVNRQGKNNVMLSCIPNPPIDEKKKDDKTPVSMLIRVKNAEDADELFDKIKEAKGAESS